MSTQLSKNFWLHEFLVSQTAERHGIDMTPPPHIIENLEQLCVEVLQPAREAIDRPFFISSGYRPYPLNRLIGGSSTSAHMMGQAADFMVHGMTPFHVCVTMMEMALPYDQLIHEFGRWIHVGQGARDRNETLTAYKDSGNMTRYAVGIHEQGALG